MMKHQVTLTKKILLDNNQEVLQFKYHHSCYSGFTDKPKLTRLRKKHETRAQRSTPGEQISQPCRWHHCEHFKDWNLCMFCQQNPIKNMRDVSTMKLSSKIISLSESDLIMHRIEEDSYFVRICQNC